MFELPLAQYHSYMSDNLQGDRTLLEYWEIRALLLKAEEELTLAEIQARDLQWLKLLSEGAQPKQLHDNFDIVSRRLAKVRSALGAKTNTEAVVIALRRGMIQ